MPPDTLSQHIGTIITSLGTLLLLIERIWSKHQEKQQKLTRESEEAQQKWKRTEWERADIEHKQKMELVALQTGRKLEVAAIAAQEAKRTVLESKKERKDQMEAIIKKIDQNTEVNEKALVAANGVNVKIEGYGKTLTDLAASAPDPDPLTKKPKVS